MFRHSHFLIIPIFFVLTFIVSIDAAPERKDKKNENTINLEEGFKTPPLDARPRAYWGWMNGNVNIPQITCDLEEMKEKGIAGLDIFDVGAKDPNNVVPDGPAFMGKESVQAIGHAVREAGRLGLEIGFLTSSSWNAGGPWVTPEFGAKGIFYSRTKVKGKSSFSQKLPFPKVPAKSPKGSDGLPAYYKNIAVIAIPFSEDNKIDDLNSIIDLTSRLDTNGRLKWQVPSGEWEILRFICAGTGERLVLPSPNSSGLIIDHFDPAATELHFQYLIDALTKELGDLGKTALTFMYLPSYEVASYEKEKGLVWTPRMLEEFKKKRGYDLTTYMPLLFGYTIDDKETAERFDFDFKMTLSDLIIDYHYTRAREICNRHGLLLCSEAGGPGQPLHNCPFDALRALGALDVPRGEFWYKHQRFDENGVDILWLVKEIACASHLYGKKIVDGEAFTSWHHWQLGPFDLKPLADRAMCGGLNRFTFHTGTHNPPEAGKPGWAYHAGTHINVNRVWWPKIKPFIDYLSRSCYLLQQGHFVGDVCYYYGGQAPNFVKPKHVDPSLGAGYDYDVTNSEAIVTRMSVEKGRIVLPDGMSYELLVLPERDDMDLDVLMKLEKLVKGGATVYGPKPTRSNGLNDYKARDAKVRRLSNRLWGNCDGVEVKKHTYGKGKIIYGRSLRDILLERKIGPDFTYDSQNEDSVLDYIHRKTDNEDIYFVSNKTMKWINADCMFRVTGKVPELWEPYTGNIQKLAIYETVGGETKLPLRLPPMGSVFVVFRAKSNQPHLTTILPEFSSCEASSTDDGRIELTIANNGQYTLEAVGDQSLMLEIDDLPSPIEITGPWEVRFPEGWGAPVVTTFPELISWTQAKEEGIQFFSGIAAYHKVFEIPASLVSENYRLTLDLGGVKDIADVYINNEQVSILWKPPFQVDITDQVKSGKNHLAVEIANQWSNRLVGDSKLPIEKRFTNTNITYSIMWKQPWEKTPLLESGLLGPVRIHVSKKLSVQIPSQ